MKSYPTKPPPSKPDHRRRALAHFLADALIDQLDPEEFRRKLLVAGFTGDEVDETLRKYSAGVVL